eukprot:c21441_g1_i1 orf=606-896(+)
MELGNVIKTTQVAYPITDNQQRINLTAGVYIQSTHRNKTKITINYHQFSPSKTKTRNIIPSRKNPEAKTKADSVKNHHLQKYISKTKPMPNETPPK